MTGSAGTIVGLVANPASGHDLRRLVSGASIATNHEKVNVVRRLLAGLGAAGVDRVLVMPDASGLTLGIERAAEQHVVARDGVWPGVELLPIDVRQTADDTRAAVGVMLDAGVGAIVVLGGDGTARVVAGVLDDTPMLALSTGTNNAFGVRVDATVGGLAAGLIATGTCPVESGCRRAKRLELHLGDRRDLALVDVAVVAGQGVGARAVWRSSDLRELVVTIAEPGAIGLSAIVAGIAPCGRYEPTGRHVELGAGGRSVVTPIAPGLVRPIEVASVQTVTAGEPVRLRSRAGVIALDGEREVPFAAGDDPTVTLSLDGPMVIDVATVLARAASRGWLSG